MAVNPPPIEVKIESVSAPNSGTNIVKDDDDENKKKIAEAAAAAPAAQQQDNVSRSFAALAKKEKMIVREREAMKAERAAIAAEKVRIAEIEAKYSTKPASPREALERYGYDYKTATEFELNDGSPTPEFIARQARDEVQKLREEQAADRQRFAEEAKQAAEQEKAAVIQEFRTEIHAFVDEKPDDYELIKFNGAQDVVYNVINEHYENTGKLLSITEGANIVEKHLEGMLEKIQQTKKFTAKIRPGTPDKPETGFSRQPDAKPQTRTLDSTLSATTPSLMKSAQGEADRMKRALAALDRR